MVRKNAPKAGPKLTLVTGGQRLRVFQRAAIVGEVIIHDDERLFIAPLSNISAGGLFIDELTNISKGITVRVVVKSPRLEHPVQAVGTVVRVEEKQRRGLAIEFTSISNTAREVIQNCVYETRMQTALKAA